MFFNKGAAGKKLDYFLSFFQYYIHAKNPLPMDIEFLVQDIFALTRPQWKLASNLEEATKVFQLAVAQDHKTSGIDKAAMEQDDHTSGMSSDDENADDIQLGDQDDDEDLGSEDGDVEVGYRLLTSDHKIASNFLSHSYRKLNTSRTATASPRTRLLSSLERKRRLIPRMKPTLTVSMRRSWLKALRHASLSASNSTFRCLFGPRPARFPAEATSPVRAVEQLLRAAAPWLSRY